MSRTITTSTATVRFQGHVIRVAYHADAEETLETAQELRDAMNALADGAPMGVLVDIRLLKASTREARKYWAEEDGEGSAAATAVLVARGLTSAIGNFWLAVNRPTVPTRLFASESDAIEWLQGFLAARD